MGAAAPVMATSAKVSARLNLLCPRVFPALGLGLGESQWAGVASESAMVIDETQWTTMKGEVTVGREWEANLGPITMSENLLKFQLQPALNSGIDRTAVPKPLLVHEVQQSLVEERPDVFEAAQQVAALWDDCSRELQEGPVHDGAKILAENVDGDTQCQDVGVATRREYTEEPWLCEDIAYTSGSASTAAMEVEGERECTGLGASSEISRAILVEERQDAVEGPLCSAETDARGKGTYATSEIADVERNKMDAANEAETKDVVTQETHSNWTRAGEESVDLPECLKGIGRREMEMVFLGTGSSMPSKYRNVSAIYVHLFERGGIMLDCGEGTYGQLRRRYGNKGADEIIARLGMIWISHIHADHHVGMLRILAVRQLLLGGPAKCPPLLLVGPRQLKPLLNAYQQLENLSVVFLDCSQTTKHAETMAQKFQSEEAADEPAKSRENSPVKGEGGRSGLVQLKEEGGKGRKRLQPFWQQQDGSPRDGLDLDGRRKLTEVLSGLGLARLESVEVNHCQHAYGVVLESLGIARGSTSDSDIQSRSKGWKLAYSGDTRPCQALVDASRGATVLIHEATFDDGLQEDAISKRHSMTKEAVKVGVLAGAYRTILTHFSQRYPKIPVIDDSYTDRTCIAFDMMSANLADLPILPKILPALKVLFKEEHMEAEEAKAEMTSQQV